MQSSMTGIEREMAAILDSLGITYSFQRGEYWVSGHCRSQYPCKLGEWDIEEESNYCHKRWEDTGEDPCEWWADGYYRYIIDFAIEGDGVKIAIECDGYRYHNRPWDRRADTHRQEDLSSAGWRVIRFSGAMIHNRAGLVRKEIRSLIESVRATTTVQERLI